MVKSSLFKFSFKLLFTWIPTTVVASVVFGIGGMRYYNLLNQKVDSANLPTNSIVSVNRDIKSDYHIGYVSLVSNEEFHFDNVNFVKPGYIIIKEEMSGKPADIIGISELIIGRKDKVVLNFDRELVSREVIYVFIYSDNGDQIFSDINDEQVKNQVDESYLKYFTVFKSDEDSLDSRM